jgi:hypothetical protein
MGEVVASTRVYSNLQLYCRTRPVMMSSPFDESASDNDNKVSAISLPGDLDFSESDYEYSRTPNSKANGLVTSGTCWSIPLKGTRALFQTVY